MSEVEQQPKPPPSLELSIGDGGRGEAVTVVASMAGDELHRDQINLNRADHRSRFARAIHKLIPRFAPGEIESQLLKLRSDIERLQADADRSDRPAGDELAAMQLTRPELVFRPGFAGVAVSRLLDTPSGPMPIWTLYRNAGGKRLAEELDPTLVVGGQTLHVHPMPCDPSIAEAAELAAWSKAGRDAWLAGDVRPTGRDVFTAILGRIDRYVELPPDPDRDADERGGGHAATLALWVMLSYCYPIFPAVPYLYLAGPAGSGKTRTMDLIGRMVFRPMFSSNISAANLFRSLHQRGGVLLLDEAERLKDHDSPETKDINSILLSGYRRGGRATRLESVGDQWRSVTFDVYSPKLLACIRGLPPELASRSITLRLSRASAGSPRASRSLDDTPEQQQHVVDLLHAWTLEHASKLIDVPAPATTLHNRDAERWNPLLRIAASIDLPDVLDYVIDHAARQVEQDADDQTPEADPALLAALHELLTTRPRCTAGDVLELATDADPDAFSSEWNARRVGAVLRRYGFRTERTGGKRVYRDPPARVANIASRYGYPIETANEASDADL